jgi:hypothetical protein
VKGMEFYSAAAQIIPLVFVVALIEMRLFGFTSYPGARAHRSAWIAVVVLGEIRALSILYYEDTLTFLDPGFVAFALFVAALPLIVTAYGQLYAEHVRPGHPARQHIDRQDDDLPKSPPTAP